MHEWAHAKINLLLNVRPGPDERGYHAVETVLCPLELCDLVEVEEAGEPGIALTCTPDPLPSGAGPCANLAYRAAQALGERFRRPLALSIRVEKRIPSQAGLGGGSSDAAAVIRALARLWGIDGADERLYEAAASLGTDVPFFLREAPTLLGRYGDVPIESFAGFACPVALVKPAGGVSTAAAYRQLDAQRPALADAAPLVEALRRADVPAVLASLANTMEGAARALQPELDEVFAALAAEAPVAGPLLCGSGSCVAAFTADDARAQAIAQRARERGWWACATRTLQG